MKPEHKHKQPSKYTQPWQPGTKTSLGSNILRCIGAALLVCILAACSTAPTAIKTTKHSTPAAATICATCPDSTSVTAAEHDLNEEKERSEPADVKKKLDTATVNATETHTIAPPSDTSPAVPSDASEQPQDKSKTSAAPTVPIPVQVPAKPTHPEPLNKYIVKDGENLYIIARHPFIYADGMLWPLIYRANRDQIKNPRQIYPGQSLNVPRDISESDKEQARSKAKESQIFSATEHE